MKVTPTCVACVLARRSNELEALYNDTQNRQRLSVLRNITESMLLYIGPDIEAAELATVTFRRAKRLTGVDKLYSDLIRKHMNKALERARKISESVNDKEDGEAIKILAKASALATGFRPLHTGGVLDEPPDLSTVSAALSFAGGRDDSEKLITYLEEIRGGTLYYIPRGALELPYDAALISRIKDTFNVKVNAVFRLERFEDYAVLSDAEELGITEGFDDIIEYASDAAALLQDEAEHIIQLLNEADLVIVKGGLQSLHMRNINTTAPRLLLFTANCRLLSRWLGARLGAANIVLEGVEAGEGPRPG